MQHMLTISYIYKLVMHLFLKDDLPYCGAEFFLITMSQLDSDKQFTIYVVAINLCADLIKCTIYTHYQGNQLHMSCHWIVIIIITDLQQYNSSVYIVTETSVMLTSSKHMHNSSMTEDTLTEQLLSNKLNRLLSV